MLPAARRLLEGVGEPQNASLVLITPHAQFIRICRWLKLLYKEQLAPLENAPFSVQWARKRCRVAQRFRQYLRATNCYKLSDFCLPHASLRVPLPQPLPTNGTGSAKQWRPQTPAMAAGLTDHVWTLREVLRFRVPPWPQPAGV